MRTEGRRCLYRSWQPCWGAFEGGGIQRGLEPTWASLQAPSGMPTRDSRLSVSAPAPPFALSQTPAPGPCLSASSVRFIFRAGVKNLSVPSFALTMTSGNLPAMVCSQGGRCRGHSPSPAPCGVHHGWLPWGGSSGGPSRVPCKPSAAHHRGRPSVLLVGGQERSGVTVLRYTVRP